jgi:hypothetical protein
MENRVINLAVVAEIEEALKDMKLHLLCTD